MNNGIIRLTCVAATAIGLLSAACGGRGDQSAHRRGGSVTEIRALDTADNLLLIPGQSAGPIHLGDADTVLHRSFGRPHFTDAAMGKAVSVWRIQDDAAEYPLSVFTSREMGNDETARIQQIRITSPRFETVESIRVGATLREISSAYSHTLGIVETYEENGETYTVYDANEGIAFEVDPTNRCVAIIIHRPDDDIASYLPLRGGS